MRNLSRLKYDDTYIITLSNACIIWYYNKFRNHQFIVFRCRFRYQPFSGIYSQFGQSIGASVGKFSGVGQAVLLYGQYDIAEIPLK